MHNFTLSSYDTFLLELDGFNYSVKAGLLLIFTILSVFFMKRKMKLPHYSNLNHQGLWNSLKTSRPIFGISLFYAIAAFIFTTQFMGIFFILYEADLISVAYIKPDLMESLIPFTASFLAASKSIKNRFFQAIKYPLLILLVIIASSSFFLSLKKILLNHIYYS